ncbi:(Fe-S)-binding protein [Deltaproteobacteria bacterium Smac51]|nr:(Fe-S)-binding protein [Deltaproteobacteria bacterium Smac51]
MTSHLSAGIEDLITRAVADAAAPHFFRKPLIGFSSADDPLFDEIVRQVGSHHLKPRDILPEAATVISFFIPFTKTLVASNKGDGPVSDDWGNSYVQGNEIINGVNQRLSEYLESQGLKCGFVPATHTFDAKTLKAGWSHRSAAAVAGLGGFGLNRMLMGPGGCAGRYGTAFTSARLQPSRPLAELQCLYLKNKKCAACVKACPVGALTEDGFDRHKCYQRLLENDKLLSADGRLRDVCGKCVAACPLAVK